MLSWQCFVILSHLLSSSMQVGASQSRERTPDRHNKYSAEQSVGNFLPYVSEAHFSEPSTLFTPVDNLHG